MTSRVEWHGDEWLRTDLVPAVELGLLRAGIVLENEMRRRMGSEGGGVSHKAKKRKTARGFKLNAKGKGRNVYLAAPPGAFPGVRTGRLRRSMAHGLIGDLPGTSVEIRTVRVGTNVTYGRYLEKGTGRMKPRPWAMRSYRLARERIDREFTKVARASLAEGARRRLA